MPQNRFLMAQIKHYKTRASSKFTTYSDIPVPAISVAPDKTAPKDIAPNKRGYPQ